MRGIQRHTSITVPNCIVKLILCAPRLLLTQDALHITKRRFATAIIFPIVVKFVIHDRSRLRRTHRKRIAGLKFDSFDDTLQYIRRISILVGFSMHPSTSRTDLSLENFQDAVVDAALSVSATTRARRINDEMQRPQNLNDVERMAKDVSKPPDIRKLARQVERTEQKKLDAPDKKGY